MSTARNIPFRLGSLKGPTNSNSAERKGWKRRDVNQIFMSYSKLVLPSGVLSLLVDSNYPLGDCIRFS